MPDIKNTLHAVYTASDIKALIIADLKQRGYTVTTSDIWPTGSGPDAVPMTMPEGHSVEFVDEYTVKLVTAVGDLKKMPVFRS